MAWIRTVELSAINVTLQPPHSAARYVELFMALGRQRLGAQIRGEYQAMIGSVRAIHEGRPADGLTGEIYKYFELDRDSKWFNVERNKIAEADERAQVHIPRDLKPHFSFYYFAFFPKGHRLFFETRSGENRLSPGAAAKMLRQLTERQNIVREFGPIGVTLEPSAESLERILRMPKLRHIHIEITPPNADTLASSRAKVMARLHSMRAQSEVTEFTAVPGKTLHLDAEAKQQAEIAQSNGFVTGEGYDASGRAIRESTKEHPLRDTVRYDPDKQTERDVVIEQSAEMLRKLRAREHDNDGA